MSDLTFQSAEYATPAPGTKVSGRFKGGKFYQYTGSEMRPFLWAPTGTTSRDYSALDCIGGLLTFSNAVDAAGYGVFIRGIALNSKYNLKLQLLIFRDNPTGSTFADGDPIIIAETDRSKKVATVVFDTGIINSSSERSFAALASPPDFTLVGTDLYLALQVHNDYVGTTTSDGLKNFSLGFWTIDA